jgi:dienelactone hydrolase
MTQRLNAAMEYGKKIPSSNGKTGVTGFCWGGTQTFDYAIAQPNLNAAVVYYGNPTAGRPSPESQRKRTTQRSRRPCSGCTAVRQSHQQHDSGD